MSQAEKLAALSMSKGKGNEKKQSENSTSFPSSAAKILDNLYLTAVGPAENPEFLKNCGITHILNLTGPGRSGKPRYPKIEDVHGKLPGYLHICKRDEEDVDIKEYLEKGHEFIWNAIGDRSSDKGGDASEGKTSNIALVHCEAGISRSSTTVITYLMKYNGMRLSEAYDLVKKRKSNVGPNAGFFRQCIELDKKLVQSSGGKYPDDKAIEIERYLAKQLVDTGGMFSTHAKSGKITVDDVYKDLKSNGCDIQATQMKFMNLLFSS